MRRTQESIVYIKGKQTVILNTNNLFVYESCVYTHYDNYFALSNKKYFTSKTEIEKIKESFFKTKHIQICNELYSAPEKWLIDNGFIVYVKQLKLIKKNDK